MEAPSKELLSAVLNEKIHWVEIDPAFKSSIFISDGGFCPHPQDRPHRQLNIHELAHKCKTWAFNQGDSMHTMYDLVVRTKNGIDFQCDIVCDCGDGDTVYKTYGDSEVQVIFWACRWIFDQVNKK
jgi:hypothetical protein